MAARFEFASNGQAISNRQQINPILMRVNTTVDVVGLAGWLFRPYQTK